MEKLIERFDKLQKEYGSKELNSVYGCGCSKNPKVALVFMNPTKRNIATDKAWTGLRAQWLGTKQIWDFLSKCGLFDSELNDKIKAKKPREWTPEFCDEVYDEVKKQKVWITNLAKCTQDDARPLPDHIFLQYKDLLKTELNMVKPEKVLFFGNQVSSIMLDEKITVSTARQKKFDLYLNSERFDAYAVYYPVGNGRFNQSKAVEDIKEILK
ncbi:MAG: hypothetical protein J6J23_01545 [Clostridia bacterium]|nr:hypothetical protein [Clostridia bacterium]